jgi:hypothetical protein
MAHGGAGGSANASQTQTATGGQGGNSEARGGDQQQQATAQGGSSNQTQSASNEGNNQSITVNNPAAPSEITIKNTPDAYAPINNPTAPCRVAHAAGGSGPGFGISFGSSTLDEGCDTREDARLLHNMGLVNESITRLCAKPEMAKALGEKRCPQPKPEPQPVQAPGA